MKTTHNDPSFPTLHIPEDEIGEMWTNAATIIVQHAGGKESRFFVRISKDEDGCVDAFLETPSLHSSRDNRTTRPLVAVQIDYNARSNG